MKSVLVVGYLGNMGQRYCAILDRLGINWVGVDLEDPYPAKDFDRVILATPTSSHSSDLNKLASYRVPVLCEKPIAKSPGEAAAHLNHFEAIGVPLAMVNQYAYMSGVHNGDSGSLTIYNYFKTGGDTLGWDCINILGLARAECILRNDSPVWQCTINGRQLKIDQMDLAYIDMIDDWMSNPESNPEYINEAHRRAHEFSISYKNGVNRYPGKIN